MRDAKKDLAMCERATPGPWNNDHDQVTKENGVPLFKAFRMRGDLQMRDDARFITEAREALPYWIKRAMATEQKLSSHDPDVRNYSNIEFVMMRDRALAAEAEIDRLKKSLHFLVTAVKTGYRAGYIDGDGFGDALMDEVSKITV